MTKDPTILLRNKSLVDFFSSHTPFKLIKTGKNYSCPCPLHGEKEASFYINPEKNRWTCYGACASSGDLIDFVSKYKSLEFSATLEYLCNIYNIEYKKKAKNSSILDDIKQINNFVGNYYSNFIEEKYQLAGRDYLLKNRNQSFNILKEFLVGYAPHNSEIGWDNLYKELCNQKFSIELCEKIGLIKKSTSGNYIDKFIGRIIFPIHNLQGDVIGFNSRLVPYFESKEYKLPRYLLSLETELFSRKKIQYGLHITKKYIEKKKICVLVEGIFDFYRLYQNGIKNSIPLLGGQYYNSSTVDTYYLMMDFDKAGVKYNSTIGSQLISENKVVRICDNKKDPDDLDRNEIINSIKESKDFVEWYISKIYKYEDSIEHKLNVLNEVCKLLVNNKEENVVLYSDKISKRLGLPLGVVVAHISIIAPSYKNIFKGFNESYNL